MWRIASYSCFVFALALPACGDSSQTSAGQGGSAGAGAARAAAERYRCSAGDRGIRARRERYRRCSGARRSLDVSRAIFRCECDGRARRRHDRAKRRSWDSTTPPSLQ